MQAPQTALILAGGFGTRLKKVVQDVPKPMAPVNGTPFLVYLLRYLEHHNVKHVIFSTGYLAEIIQNYFKDTFNTLRLTYVQEKEALGTGGGIRLAIDVCEEDHCYVLNGDSFFDIDLNAFYRFHHASAGDHSLALREVTDASRYGTVELEGEQIVSFKEKTVNGGSGIINGGTYILNKEHYLGSTPPSTRFSIEKDFFEKNLSSCRITGKVFNNYFIDIGIPEDYSRAQDEFKTFKY